MNSHNKKEKFWGFLFGLLAAFCYGWILIFTKLAYQGGMTTFLLLRDRFWLAAFFLWGFYLFFLREKLVFNFKTVIWGLLLGAITYGIMVLAYFYALNFISASLTALILYLAPTLTTCLAKFFFKEPITIKKGAALILPFIGASLIIGFQVGSLDYRGIILAFVAVILSSFYVIILQKLLKNNSPHMISLLIVTGAALFYSVFESPLTFLRGMIHMTLAIPFLLLVFISTIPPIFLSISAIEKIGGVRTIMLSPIDPLTTLIAAYFILGERLTLIQIIGGGLIIIGVLLVFKIK
jgi:drug/metabolite transporter (DMT)-like permease